MKLKLGTLLAAAVLTAAPAMADQWYQWRGPEQNGVSRETHLPEKWTPEGENLAWSNDVGGMSCPIVMNGHVYTFSRVGEVPAGEGFNSTYDPGPKTQEALTCVDEKTGKVVWQYTQNMFMTDAPFHRLGWSSPVGDPATGHVYALGTQATLVCCDAKTGKPVWTRQMTEEFGMISTFGGRTASPALDEDQIFITGVSFGWGNNAGSQHRIFALNKETGELNWTAGTGGIPVDAPYNTPTIAVIGGQKLVLFAGGDGGIHAFQARTGKKVWTYKASKHGMNSSVIVHGDHVFCSWDLDNFDTNKLGGVACLDGSKVTNGEPAVVWKQQGIEAGFPSPTLADGTLYILTDNAMLFAMDEKTGAIKYKQGMGTIGKASLTYGDGKLYVAEANGRVSILKPEKSKFKRLDRVEVEQKLGREYVIFGAPAICDGHVFLQTATKTYCIGPKDFQAQDVQIPEQPKEEPIGNEKPDPALIQVLPADLVLHPGQKATFTARAFDAKGRALGAVKPEQWEVGQLLMPPPPPRPKELMRPNTAAAAQGKAAEAPKPAAPPTPPPASGPTMVGNLEGEVTGDGVFTPKDNAAHIPQGGGIIAHVGKLEGIARVRVFPPLPWKADFEKAMVGKPPLTWIGAGMKFAVREEPGNPSNKVLVKLTDIPLFARARTYFGTTDMSNYTVQADVKAAEKVFNDNGNEVHKMPDAGVINSRYVLELQGSNQALSLHAWPAALPRNQLLPGLAVHKTIPFPWKANTWYTEKVIVTHEGDQAMIRGKVWEKGQSEPQQWTIELQDPTPNVQGPAGLWGFSNDLEIYYDNIIVTPNNTNAAASAARSHQ